LLDLEFKMPILTATLDSKLSTYLLVDGDDTQCFAFKSGGFSVDVEILVNDIPRMKTGNKSIGGSNRIIITAHKEEDFTPDIPITASGLRDFSNLQDYFNTRSSYHSICSATLVNIIRYFKYTLHQPYLSECKPGAGDFSWQDNRGNDYGSLSVGISLKPIPGMNKETMNIQPLDKDHHEFFSQSLSSNSEPTLTEEIYSDSQTALLDNDLRKGIVNLCVTVDTAIKGKLFSGAPSSSAFDYLDDKGKINLPLIEYLGPISNHALGESFKAFSLEDYKNIDYLIRCRNKVAHKGEIYFKLDNGVATKPNREMAEQWYLSVGALLDWVDSK
jgi:hypothetical protein